MLLSESRNFRVTLLKKQASLTFPQKVFHTFQMWFTGIQHFLKISAHSILDECILGRYVYVPCPNCSNGLR